MSTDPGRVAGEGLGDLEACLRSRLHLPLAEFDLPPSASKELQEARRVLQGLWHGVHGCSQRIAALEEGLEALRREQLALRPWRWLRSQRLQALIGSAEEELSDYRARFEGLLASAVHQLEILHEAGAQVRFLPASGEGDRS